MSSKNENLAKSKSLVWLYSGIGVVLSFVILVVLNLIVSTSIPVKLDLTEDKVHTLSKGTKDILSGLDKRCISLEVEVTDKMLTH